MEWQPIETAPKDGRHILILTPMGAVEGYWAQKKDDGMEDMGHDAGWMDIFGYTSPGRSADFGEYQHPPSAQPSHWTEIPEWPE